MFLNKDGFEKTTRKCKRRNNWFIKNNGRILRKDLCIILNLTKGSIRHHLNKLQIEGKIEHIFPNKGGYRKVND